MKVSILGLDLIVDPALHWGQELLRLLSDVVGQSTEHGPMRGSLEIAMGTLPGAPHLHVIEPDLARVGDTLIDRRYGVQIRLRDDEHIELRTQHSCPEWYSWALQLCALRSGTTFVHAAGLERNGAALLLAARNNFGKTALIGDFVQRRGFRLMGDDLTVLAADGTCYAYPRALTLHSAHRSFFPDVFAHDRAPAAPAALNGVIERVTLSAKPLLRRVPGLLEFARRHHPDVLRIAPSRVFGVERLAARAQLHTILWLERSAELKKPVLSEARSSMPARAFGSTIDEFDDRCVHITHVAMAAGLLPLETSFGAWMDVLRIGLQGAHAFSLSLPASLPLEEMPAVVFDVMTAEGLIGELEAATCV
ncbi:MAG TPA: hypothetical protein VFO52_03830 [Longimicrobiales bacterium]|nr:hypothetical protein [Longimicrobiales bacterium]